MPAFTTDPHHYDAVAGFDTSALFSAGAFNVAALQDGTGGVAIAAAARAAGSTAGGLALIAAVAADQGVSPIWTYASFAGRTKALGGSAADLNAVGAAIAGRFANPVAGVTDSLSDLSSASGAGQIAFADVIGLVVGIAAAGTDRLTLLAGMTLGNVVQQQPRGGEGGEGGGSEGGGGATSPISTAVTAAQAALSGGTLTTMRFVALMAGLDGTVSDFRNTARNAALTTIGTDAGLIASTLRMLASASPAVSYLSSLANFINALGDWGSLDLATVLQTIRAEVSAGNLTAAAAIRLGEALVYYAYGLTSNRDSVFASEVVAQIDAGLISATSAVAALGAVRDEFGVYEADRHLMDLVSARNTATIRIAVAQQIAASVYNIDPNVMDPASQGNRILVSNAIGFIRGRIDAGITATDATTMLTAVAALGGYALRAIGDNLRTNAPGTATIDTVAAAADALGLTAAQKITVLAGIGGSSAMQLQGNSSVWVANADFQTAAAGWILGVANTAQMSAADLAGAFIAALPDAAGGGNLYWQEIGRVLIDMATVGSNPDAAQARYVGAAIAAYVSSGPVGVASMIGLIDGMVRISQTMTVDQSLSVLIGMAANGGLAVQAAAAGEIADLATRNVMQLATGVTAITSALNASILTNARAATLLAGIVGASAIGTVGTAAIDALVTLAGSSTSTLTDAIQAAVSGSALSLDAALRVYAEVAGRSSTTVQGAITTAMLSLVPSNGIEAAITTLATEAASGTTGVQIAIGRQIAAFVAQGGVTGARAIALIDGLIGANTLTAARALAVLVGFGAGDSGRETLVQTEIATLVTNGAITAAAAVSALQGLQSGAASDVSTVIDDALAGLITDPASLAQTAGLGTPAQVLLVARTIAGYMSTDPTAAATILDGLSPRIRAGSLTGAQAARLLIDVAAQGGGAQTVAILRLTVLATVQQGQSAADVALSDITGQVSALLGAGTLGSAIALDVLDHLISLGGASIRSAIAGLVGTDSTSSITVAQIAAAVGNASLSDSDAISILGVVAKANGGALQASAISQIATLATDPTTVQQAVDAFAAIGSGATAAIRAAGYTALNTLLGANAGLADRAFNAILPFAGAGDAGVRADAVAEIATLVGSLGLSTTTVLTEINAQLASSAAVLTANQALAVLVGLLGVPAAESTVFQAIDSIASNNHYSQQTPRPGFTAEAAITAIAGAYGDDSARAATTAQELRVLKTLVGTPSFLGALAGVAASTQFAVLSNLLPNADADTSTAYIQRIVTLLAGMSSTDATTARTGLLNNSALSAAQAAQLAVAYYVSGSASAFLSAAGSMNAGVLTGGIADLVTAGTVSVLSAQEMLAVLAAQGTAGLKSSAVTKLSDALVGQTSLATALISHISGFIDSAVLTGAQAVGLFARMLLSNPSALGSALQAAELDLITQGKIGYLDAVTAVAETAAGVNAAGMATVAQEIAGILSGRTIDASRVADAIAAPAGGPSPSLTTAQDVALLIAVGGAVGEPMLTAAGRKIGAFAAAGSIAGDAAGYAIYQAKVDGLVTAAQGVAIAIGALAGGSPAAANAAIYQFLYQNAISASDVATALDGAVAAGTITATATVDLAESFLNTSISTDATVAILSTLITNARATGAAVVGELGSFIGTVGATISPALFMSVVAKVATSAAGTSGADASIGLGLADLIAANKITKAQVSDGLVLAVNGATTPVQNAATLSFANALTMLVGMAADTATAAVTAGVAGTAGSLAAALAGSDATRLADAETAFDGAKTAGTLTAAQLLKVYAGLVGAGVSASATGVHLAGLVAAGTLSVYDLYTLNGLLPADTYTTVIASAALTMIAAGGTTTLVRQALENDLFAVVGTDNGQISSTTSLSLIGAAGTAIGTPSSATALLLTEMGQYPTRLAFGVGAGAELARQVAAGSVSASDALSSASVAMLAGMAEADRLQVASVSSTFRDLIYATLQARAAAPMTASVAATLVQLITDGALSAANGLDVIAQAAHRFGQSFALNLGGALKPLLVAGTVTPTQIGTALSDAGIAGTEAIVFLASMIDPRQINANTLLSRQILDATRDLLTTSGTTAGVQALTTALAGAVTPTGAILLSPAQAVAAWAALASVLDAQSVAPILTQITQWVTATRLDAATVHAVIGQTLAALPAGSRLSTVLFELQVARGLGESASQLVGAIVNATAAGLGVDAAIEVLGSLTTANSARYLDQTASNQLYAGIGAAAGAGIAALVAAGQTDVSHALGGIAAVSGVSDDNRALLYLGFGGAATAAGAISAGRALAAFVDGGGAPDLESEIFGNVISPERAALVLGGMALNGSVATAAQAASLFASVGQVGGSSTIATLIGALGAAHDSGALSSLDEFKLLGLLSQGVHVAPSPFGHLTPNNAEALRAALDAELLRVAGTNPSTVSAAMAMLAGIGAGGSASLMVGIGRLLGTLEAAGRTTASAIISAVSGGNLTTLQKIAVLTGAALSDTSIAAPLGTRIGERVAAGLVTADDAISTIADADAAYATGSLAAEATMLIAAAVQGGTNMPVAAGARIGTLFARGLASASILASIDAATGTNGSLPAINAADLLAGMASTAPDADRLAIAAEIDVLIGAGKLSLVTVTNEIKYQVAIGRLSLGRAADVLVAMVAGAPGTAGDVASALTIMIAAQTASGAQVLGALYAAAGIADRATALPGTDAAIAAVIQSLIANTTVSLADASTAFATAAATPGAFSGAHGLAIALAMAATGAAAANGFGATLPALLADGLTTTALGSQVAAAVGSGALTLALAVRFLGFGTYSADANHLVATERAAGSALAALIGAGVATPAQLVTELRALVADEVLDPGREAALIAAAATGVAATVDVSAFTAELSRLITAPAISAADLFSSIEAVAGSPVGARYATVIASLDRSLAGAIGTELASLVARNLISASDLATAITVAPIAADLTDRYLATALPADTAGAAMVGLVTAGRRTLGDLVTDLGNAVTAGAIDRDAEIKLIAAIAVRTADQTGMATLGAALTALVTAGSATAAQIFSDIGAYATAVGSYSTRLGQLIGAMSATGDAALQASVGAEIQRLVGVGSLPADSALDAIIAGSGGSALAPAALASLLSMAASGNVATQAAVGDRLGRALSVASDRPSAAADLKTRLDSAVSASQISAVPMAGVLAGLATTSYTGMTGATAVTGEVNGLVLSGALSIADARGFLASVTSEPLRAFFAQFAQLNAQALTGTDGMARARLALDSLIVSTYYATYQSGVTRTQLEGLVTALGGLGSTSALARFAAAATANAQAPAQAAAALNALDGSGVLTATSELASLVGAGALTAQAAVQAVAAGIGTLGATKVVAWLAELSARPAFATAVADQIAALISGGTLTAAAAITTIGGITNQSSASVGAAATISTTTATSLLVGLAARGDTALLDAAGVQLATLIGAPQGASAMSPTGILNTIDAAITGGGLGGTKGVRLLADMAVRMTGNGIVSDYLTTHLPGYVTGGAVSLADVVAVGQAVATEAGFQGRGALVSASFAGNLVDLAGGASTAVTQIRSWVSGGTLSGERGVAALLGVIAQENGIQAARFQADPNASYQVVTARTDAAFAAAKAEILSMISAGRVTGATVAADLQALGGLSSAQSFGLLIDLARTGDSATQAAVATMLVGMGTKWGPASDPFFSGALIQAAKDFAAVVGGTMSVGAAIADVKAYAKANGASTDAGLVMLGSLLGQYDFVTNAPGSRRAPVDTELTNRIAVGDMAAELAGRVAQGTTPFVPAFGAQPQPTDPSAISYADAKALLSRMVDQYATSHTAADALFAMDVSISQIARTASFNWDSIPGRVLTELQRGLTYTGLSSATINTINSTQIAGYAYDQALAALVDRLGSSTAPTAAGNAAQVRDILSRRLMTGVAATDLVNQVANGTMTTDQVKAAVDKLLAPVVAGLDADSAALMRKTAFGWLAIKSSQYIEGNYQIVTNADGTKSQTYLQSPVNDLFSMLLGEVRDDALAGLGAITSIQNKAMVSAADLATGFKVVQTIYSNIASSVVSTFSNLGNSDVVKAASDAAQAAIRAAAPLFEAGWTAMQGQWDKSAGSQGLPGVLHDEVVANPKDYKGYIDLGAQLAATGVPGGGLFKLTNISGNIWNELAGNGAATAVMVVSVGSKVMTAILGINAVSNALGSAAPALKGVFNVTGATADLLGNVVAGVVKAEAQTYAKAAIDLGTSFANLGTGNFSGLQSSAGDVAKGLFTLTSGGFSPEDLGAVGASAGQAIVDLMSGNPKDAGASARALGENVLKALTGNVYLSAAKDAVLRYADTIANDLFSAAAAAIDFVSNLIHNPKVVSSSPQDLIKDLASIAAVGFKDPKSLSNYGNFYHGSAVDGYLAGATVFVDANGNGVLDAGEYSTPTDNNGAYSLPAGLIGPIVITGGTDTGTGLANPAAYTAPAGSAIVSPLTTLVQKVAQATGDTSSAGIEAAKRSVATAVGLSSGTDLLSLDPEAGALQGDTAATAAFQAGAALINIVTLIGAAGGSAAGQSVFANLATQIAGGATVNLTDGAAVNGLAASLATSAGLSSAAASAIGSIAGASTSALAADLAGANSATARYTLIISAALATQTAGARAVASAAASGDAAAFAAAATDFTTNLPATLTAAKSVTSIKLPASADIAPTISGTASGQTVAVGGTATPFAGVTIADPDVGATESVVLTVMVNGVASDATGTLSGAGLTKTGTGVYTLTSGSPADVTARLRALVFTPAAGITTPQATTISVQASDGILTTTDTATSLLVGPVDASGPTGQGWGDVHMVTFKGLAYDFMAVGDYTLVKSVEPGNAFDIQIRTSGEHGVMSYTTEIAAQVGANTVDFELDGAVKLNGVATPITVGSVRKIDGGTISRTKDDTYVVNWETGESLKVVNKGGEYFDEMVSLGPNARPGSVVGLLGANTTQANDIQLADGTVLHNPTNDELVGAYASSWSVGTDLSLLDDGGLLPAAMSNLGDAATPFNGKSSIDLAGFDASKATLAFSEDAAGGFGTLTVTSGSQHTAILLMGQYAAAGFGIANDGHGGTTIDYQPPRPTLLG